MTQKEKQVILTKYYQICNFVKGSTSYQKMTSPLFEYVGMALDIQANPYEYKTASSVLVNFDILRSSSKCTSEKIKKHNEFYRKNNLFFFQLCLMQINVRSKNSAELTLTDKVMQLNSFTNSMYNIRIISIAILVCPITWWRYHIKRVWWPNQHYDKIITKRTIIRYSCPTSFGQVPVLDIYCICFKMFLI